MGIYTLPFFCPLVYIIRVEDRGADAKSSQPHHHSSPSKPQSGAEQRDSQRSVTHLLTKPAHYAMVGTWRASPSHLDNQRRVNALALQRTKRRRLTRDTKCVLRNRKGDAPKTRRRKDFTAAQPAVRWASTCPLRYWCNQRTVNPWHCLLRYDLTIRSRSRKQAQIAHSIRVALNPVSSVFVDERNHDVKPQRSHAEIMANIARNQEAK